MKIHQALILVREKFMDEQEGIITGPNVEEYKQACKDFPAIMTTAHILWAQEFSERRRS
jgi:hypothetical protein